jgi:hypothetical protein
MLVVLGISSVICALLMWGAERVDAPRRRAERQARMIQPAE